MHIIILNTSLTEYLHMQKHDLHMQQQEENKEHT